MRKIAAIVCVFFVSYLAGTHACAEPIYEYLDGHAHMSVVYEDGTLHLHFHGENVKIRHIGSGVVQTYPEFEAHGDEVVIVVPQATETVRPAGSQWDFLGIPAGAKFYQLPQYSTPGIPFFGVGTEELDFGVLVSDRVTFSLLGVPQRPSGGQFALYQFGMSGPERIMDTADGSFANDSFTFPAGTHGHYNFAFTEPGFYTLTIGVSGQRTAAYGGGTVSTQSDFHFQVVPEPSTIALLCTAVTAAVVLAGRRRNRR